MKKTLLIAGVITGSVFMAGLTYADSKVAKAAMAMCENVKQCTMQQLKASGQDMSDAMMQMMEANIKTMCDSMSADMPMVDSHPLADDATKCMQSMAKLTCDQMMDMSEEGTPECESYRKKAERYAQ